MTLKQEFIFGFFLLLILLLPGALLNYSSATSMMPGVVLFCVIFLVYCKSILFHNISTNKYFVAGVILFFVFILLHAALVYAPHYDIQRFLLSSALLFGMTLLAYSFFILSSSASNLFFNNLILKIYWFLILLGLVSIFLIKHQLVYIKSMLFFVEPSHFALVFAPFYLYMVTFSDKKLLHYFLAILLVILLKNITLAVVFLVVLFLTLKTIKLYLVTFLSLALIALFMPADNLAYFTDRLNLSSDSGNLSVLVYLSGFERSWLALTDGFGLGVGFQQMGIVGPEGIFQLKIAALDLGFDTLNLLDGGTLASKIIVEFGYFGVLLLLLYLFKLIEVVRCFYRVGELSPQALFYSSIYIMFSVVLFIRGAGYINPSFFLFLVSVCFLLFKSLNIQTDFHVKNKGNNFVPNEGCHSKS